MKKSLAMLLVLVLLTTLAGAVSAFAEEGAGDVPPRPPMIKDGAAVVSVFACENVYPLEKEGQEPLTLDGILIYFSDNTFDQYAQSPVGYELFSTGTYAFRENGSFSLSGEENIIEVTLNQKYSLEKDALVEDQTKEEYDLSTIRSHQIFGPEDGREVEAVFADDYSVNYTNDDNVISRLDAIWLYFSDGTFAEYAFLDGNVVQFGKGSYQLSENGDFHILPDEEDYGTISMTWEDSLGGLAGQTVTFNLGTMGTTCLYEKQDDTLLKAPPAR